MTRRSFITSLLQSLALVGALKLGLGNMTAEDVREPAQVIVSGEDWFVVTFPEQRGLPSGLVANKIYYAKH